MRPGSRGGLPRDWGGLFASFLGFVMYLAVGWVLGFPDWVIQQSVLFLLILSWKRIPDGTA